MIPDIKCQRWTKKRDKKNESCSKRGNIGERYGKPKVLFLQFSFSNVNDTTHLIRKLDVRLTAIM